MLNYLSDKLRRVAFLKVRSQGTRFHGVSAQSCPAFELGLVGAWSGYGLAHQNHEIADHLPVTRWLCNERFAPAMHHQTPICRLPDDIGADRLRRWLHGLDAILFVERPTFDRLPELASSMGIRVICVPMWEWLHPDLEWLRCVDLMLCPTHYTMEMLRTWQTKHRFHYQVAHVPWPIDVDRFVFRQRDVCQRFLYVHGSGGSIAVGLESGHLLRRKGLETILAAARLVPQMPFVVCASAEQLPLVLPPNVIVKLPPPDNRGLYTDGDVCVQPSLWEGLGRPLLECQAAGLPLITGDAPPMNEHRPLRRVPIAFEQAQLAREIVIPTARMRPEDLAESLRSIYGRNIARQSWQARRFVERCHSWQTSGRTIVSLIQQSIAHAS